MSVPSVQCAGYVWMVPFKIHGTMFVCRTPQGRRWYGTDTSLKRNWHVTDTELTRHRYGTDTVLIRHRYGTDTSPIRNWHVTDTELTRHWYGTDVCQPNFILQFSLSCCYLPFLRFRHSREKFILRDIQFRRLSLYVLPHIRCFISVSYGTSVSYPRPRQKLLRRRWVACAVSLTRPTILASCTTNEGCHGESLRNSMGMFFVSRFTRFRYTRQSEVMQSPAYNESLLYIDYISTRVPYCWWGLRFSRRVWRWLSSGLLRRTVW
jgi:hypothetical protein